MLLKRFVMLLLLLNIGYLAYTEGWFNRLLGEDQDQREPWRLTQQVNADAVEIKELTPQEVQALAHEAASPAADASANAQSQVSR